MSNVRWFKVTTDDEPDKFSIIGTSTPWLIQALVEHLGNGVIETDEDGTPLPPPQQTAEQPGKGKTVPCPRCKGGGLIYQDMDWHECPLCSETGRIPHIGTQRAMPSSTAKINAEVKQATAAIKAVPTEQPGEQELKVEDQFHIVFSIDRKTAGDLVAKIVDHFPSRCPEPSVVSPPAETEMLPRESQYWVICQTISGVAPITVGNRYKVLADNLINTFSPDEPRYRLANVPGDWPMKWFILAAAETVEKTKPFTIEECWSSDELIGWRLSIGTDNLLVWANQSVMSGFRSGSKFTPDIDEVLTYKKCDPPASIATLAAELESTKATMRWNAQHNIDLNKQFKKCEAKLKAAEQAVRDREADLERIGYRTKDGAWVGYRDAVYDGKQKVNVCAFLNSFQETAQHELKKWYSTRELAAAQSGDGKHEFQGWRHRARGSRAQ